MFFHIHSHKVDLLRKVTTSCGVSNMHNFNSKNLSLKNKETKQKLVNMVVFWKILVYNTIVWTLSKGLPYESVYFNFLRRVKRYSANRR